MYLHSTHVMYSFLNEYVYETAQVCNQAQEAKELYNRRYKKIGKRTKKKDGRMTDN